MLLLCYHVVTKLGFHYLIIMLNICGWNLIFKGYLAWEIFHRGLWSFWSRINRGVGGSEGEGLVLGVGLCLVGNFG